MMTTPYRNTYAGAVTLVFTVVLLILSTLIVLFAANFGRMQDKIISNMHRNKQAFTAAEAGMEFGINYLLTNRSTVTANPSGGYINYTDSNTTNITMANNSRFSVVYTNPVANNYDLILITSTGISNDASATRIVKQLVQFGSLLSNIPDTPISSLDAVDISGNTIITNLESNITITSGSSVNLSGSSSTLLSSGVGSTPTSMGSDVQQNSSTLQGLSQSDFFSNYFEAPASSVKASTAYYYTNGSNTNYSSTLNGKTGTSIWIDQTSGAATINGNITIGSAANPVILIVNGNLNLSGNVTFYGLLYVTGTSTQDITGNIALTGALISSNQLKIHGSAKITYDSSLLQKIQSLAGLGYYAKVQGSWSDF